ncbi:helix-turn-helix domain-containing protein [Chryseobacterium soldanellicola]|uniref:helix-turn-helix domain-containing protein n=1 Tax=Chryseobacterium soldanellicola TaxID=311333 RepID=UPI001E2EF3A1|nr:helix-turn-helix domain-containing protein [Chryseobacterium soldanellicola]
MGKNLKNINKKEIINEFFSFERFKNSLFFLLIFFVSIFTNGQSGPDFTILADKAFQKLYQNPDDCINYTQSLLNSDQNTEHKIVLQNIISQAYAMKGNYVESVTISGEMEDAGKQNYSGFLKLFTDYSLADQYQNLDLYHQSQKIISDLLNDKKTFRNDDQKSKITIAKLYQLQGLNYGITRDYNKALENFDKSDQYIDTHNEENKIIGFENKIFRSSYLMKQGKVEEARIFLENVIINLNQHYNYQFLTALAYENLSRYFFIKQDYGKAVENLEKSLLKIQNLPYNGLKVRIYESLSNNYFALHNDEKYHQYNKLYMETKTQLDSGQREGIRYIVKLVENYQNKNLEFQKQNELKRFWILASILLLIIVVLIIYFLAQNARNKEVKKQFEFFEKQNKRTLLSPVSAEKSPEKDCSKISKEKEEEILQKLREWELSDQYLSKSMSLSMLSAQMGVNTKYLSEVINNSKGKNFNGYINELRINHIAHLLKTDPVYLNYKVSYLAEFSGFSSHSAFTTVFKSVTGMSPNAYIQEISKSRTS